MAGGGKSGCKDKVKKGADVLQQKSPAEFFAENKNIAGFDNVSFHHFYYNKDTIHKIDSPKYLKLLF